VSIVFHVKPTTKKRRDVQLSQIKFIDLIEHMNKQTRGENKDVRYEKQTNKKVGQNNPNLSWIEVGIEGHVSIDEF